VDNGSKSANLYSPQRERGKGGLMRVLNTYFAQGSGFISMTDDVRYIMFFVFSQDGLRRVLEEHQVGEEHCAAALHELCRRALPEMASQETMVLEGRVVSLLNRLTESMAEQSKGQSIAFLDRDFKVYGFFLSKDPDVKDALIGYSDEKGRHHMVVCHSKEQVRQLVHNMDRLYQAQRRRFRDLVRACGLPDQTSQPMFSIEGPVAAWFNSASMLHRSIVCSSEQARWN